MNILMSKPNGNGVLEPGYREVVASHGRSQAVVEIALAEDGLYRNAVSLRYSTGGCCGPISLDDQGYATCQLARYAGLEQLLKQWHNPWPSEPQSVHEELNRMRSQIEHQLRQPSLI